jgi:predicted transcriptional regulator of viral defense system
MEDVMILQFLTKLTRAGTRIFSKADARKIALSMKLQERSLNYVLKELIKQKLIRPLYRGNYVIEDTILSGSPLNPFEIAEHLARDGIICCWSATSYHELTEQILSTVFVYSPQTRGRTRSKNKYTIEGYKFVLIQTDSDNIWGIERKTMGDRKIRITDLERTLIDGLTHTQYCGGFREVLSAFEKALERIDITRLIAYSKKCTVVAQKRLGWILDNLSMMPATPLKIARTNYYDVLDPTGPRRGKYNKKWMILENF